MSSHVSMSIDSNLFRARVWVYNFNMWSCKKTPNIHIKRLSTMPLKKSFKISFLMLIVFLYELFFLIFIFEGTSESITKPKLALPDYMFTIMSIMKNFKYLLLLSSGDIKVNSGRKRSSNIKFCHWNLNDLAAYDFIEIRLVKTFIASNNSDIACLKYF